MIAAIRIRGLVSTRAKQESTMESLMLRRKYNCILLNADELIRIRTVREMLTFGEISDETLKELVVKRGKKNHNPIQNADEIVKGLKAGKTLRELGVQQYFGLHPPIGGFKRSTKLPYPQGILGHNKDFEKLIRKML